jgi:hypothetical protein
MPTRPTTATTTTAHNGSNGRDPSYGQQTANTHAGWNAWANGGTRGQAQAQAQAQAPTIRQAAFNPGTPARMMPAAATPTGTMSNGGRSGSGGRR